MNYIFLYLYGKYEWAHVWSHFCLSFWDLLYQDHIVLYKYRLIHTLLYGLYKVSSHNNCRLHRINHQDIFLFYYLFIISCFHKNMLVNIPKKCQSSISSITSLNNELVGIFSNQTLMIRFWQTTLQEILSSTYKCLCSVLGDGVVSLNGYNEQSWSFLPDIEHVL